MLDFWVSQIAVIGPVMIAAALVGQRHFQCQPFLAAFTLPPLLIVSFQAVLDSANANRTVGAYFAGTVLAVSVLADHPRWRALSSVINIAVSLMLVGLTLVPDVGPPGNPPIFNGVRS